jgi:hypothetical protein
MNSVDRLPTVATTGKGASDESRIGASGRARFMESEETGRSATKPLGEERDGAERRTDEKSRLSVQGR